MPAISTVIAVDKASFDKLALDDGMGQVTVNYVYEKTGENLVDPGSYSGYNRYRLYNSRKLKH